jgi:hypothetical protein
MAACVLTVDQSTCVTGSEILTPCVPGPWLASAVAVVAAVTVCVNTADVLGLKLLSPLYLAVMEWLPTDRLDVVNEAILPVPSVDVPSETLPSRKVTVPVGVPGEPVTVAVKVTAWPDRDGLSEETMVVVVFLLLFPTV